MSIISKIVSDEYRARLVTWMTVNHISYSQVESEAFRDFIAVYSLAAVDLLPRSGTTIKNWVLDEFQKQKVYLRSILTHSKSVINLSFDLWTAPNNVAYIDVIAHFVSKDHDVKTVLLAVRQIHGIHSGENIAKTVVEVIGEYQVDHNVGCFMLDNATSNDTCVTAILKALYPDLTPDELTMKTKERRLRCFGHIVNLVAKALVFGENPDFFEMEASVAESLEDPEAAIKVWRKKGSIGKLQNLVTYTRQSPQREEAFRDVVRFEDEIGTDYKSRFLNVIKDQKTRWNSTYLMMSRAITLQYRVESFCDRFKKETRFPIHDILTANDWAELKVFHDLLKPLYHQLTIRLQGNPSTGQRGDIGETLICFEILLNHFEHAKIKWARNKEHKFLASAINYAWVVLESIINYLTRPQCMQRL